MAGEEFAQINPTEAKASQIKAELEDVLNSEITPENIINFGSSSIDKIAKIVTRVAITRFSGKDEFTAQEEDIAIGELGLGIGETLDKLQIVLMQKDAEIKGVLGFLKNAQISEKVLIPTGDRRIPTNRSDKTKEEHPDTNRVEMAIYLLNHHFNIPFDEIKTLRGQVSKEMVRKTPYVRIEARGKVIYVCNESENSTYILDLKSLPENVGVNQLDEMKKEELEVLVHNRPGKNFALKKSKKWGENFVQAFGEKRVLKKRRDSSEMNPYNYPTVIKDRKHEYLGFILIDGKYWGSMTHIRKYLGITHERAKEITKNLKSIKIYRRKVCDAYSLDEVREIDNPQNLPVGKMLKGEWNHFALLDEKHYGIINTMFHKLKVVKQTLMRFIRENNIQPRKIYMYSPTDAYCYEEILEKMEEVKKIPLVIFDQEYNGELWKDNEGNHWGSDSTIARLIPLESSTIIRLRAKRSIQIRSSELVIVKGYCLEELKESFRVKPLKVQPR